MDKPTYKHSLPYDNSQTMSSFGLASIKQEGAISNPDDWTWECDLDKCEKCRRRYERWKKAYVEQHQQ